MDDAWRIYTAALAGSAIIFISHKIEDRFTDTPGKSCEEGHPHAWQCKFPGQIVSHKPWDVKTGIVVTLIYAIIATSITAAVSRMAFHVAHSTQRWTPSFVGLLIFTILWAAWGGFETHHMKKTHMRMLKNKSIKRGTCFSRMFTQFIYFVFLPVTLWFMMKTAPC